MATCETHHYRCPRCGHIFTGSHKFACSWLSLPLLAPGYYWLCQDCHNDIGNDKGYDKDEGKGNDKDKGNDKGNDKDKNNDKNNVQQDQDVEMAG